MSWVLGFGRQAEVLEPEHLRDAVAEELGATAGRYGEGVNRRVGERITTYKDLRVFHNAMDVAMRIFELTKEFPPEEKYSMVDQMRRS